MLTNSLFPSHSLLPSLWDFAAACSAESNGLSVARQESLQECEEPP